MNNLLAQVSDPIGKIEPSIALLLTPAVTSSGELVGIISFLNTILKLFFVIAGLYGFINIILAGFGFMTASGDPKAVGKAWEKILQSFLGLIIIVCSFLIAAIIGIILFKDPTAILNPKL